MGEDMPCLVIFDAYIIVDGKKLAIIVPSIGITLA
jgi:hypothetical protein